MPGQPSASNSDLASFTKGFIAEIDGLRAFAIIAVLLHRFWPSTGALASLGRYAELGWVGVDLFFVISGFLIAGILLDTRERPSFYKNFYARRALRIFPLYYVFVGALFIVFPLAQGGSYMHTPFVESAGSPLFYLFYLGNLPESVGGHDPPFLLAPVWSLAIEEQFYITFPFLVAVLERRTLAKVLVGVILFAPLLRLVTMLLFPANERIQYEFTLCRLDVISMGCLLAVLLRTPGFSVTKRQITIATCAMLAVSAVAFVLSGLDRTRPFARVGGYSLVAVTFACVVLWTVLHRGTSASRFLRFPPLAYVGKLCYGLYLLHRPASDIVDVGLGRLDLDAYAGSLVVILVKCVVALGLATVSWYAFERPILRLKARFDSRAHPEGQPPPLRAPAVADPRPTA